MLPERRNSSHRTWRSLKLRTDEIETSVSGLNQVTTAEPGLLRTRFEASAIFMARKRLGDERRSGRHRQARAPHHVYPTLFVPKTSSNPNSSVGTICPDCVATNRHPCQGGYV